MQSMLFVKQAGKPGQAWHQDEFYIPTRDRSLVGAWIALDDATIENGGLWIIPGSHQAGVLYRMRQHGDDRFDGAAEAYDFPHSEADAIPVEVQRGDVVFFHGYTLHRSLPNRAPSGYRRALVNHYMRAESLLPWNIGKPEGGRTDYRDIVMVAGTDPYAYKGTEEIVEPFLRLDRTTTRAKKAR
jgi:ectoine hydroxylase-related dioxygenase (phytanoyl-CoA dioxygenase family)